MNNTINPYSNLQETISLKLKNLVDATVDFKFMFFMEDMSCKNEPMYNWLVNTRKLASGLKKDSDRHLIKNQRRETSWINDDFGYWSSATRYFVIGYAIEECKTRGMNLAVDIGKLADIFNDEDAHKALIDRFLSDFFFDSDIDIYGKNLCRNRSLSEHKMLNACFVNGYRLCADLYLALDQAKQMGPVHSYMELVKTCQALGFDELPLWYIQESNNHNLNIRIKDDIEAQKHIAVWAFSNDNNQLLLVAKNDPYGVEGSVVSQPSNNGLITTTSRVKRKPRKARSVSKKESFKSSEEKEGIVSNSSLDSLLEVSSAVDTQPLSSNVEEDLEVDIEIDVESDVYHEEVKPKVTGKPLSLLNQFST